MYRLVIIVFVTVLCIPMNGCISVPSTVKPVSSFNQQRYLGTWYEIARLDHSFERGLTKVYTTYQLGPDGTIIVTNRGFDPIKNRWNEAIGKASAVDSPEIGHLKVTFFWPFYSSYIVSYLDPTYQYAVVTGPTLSYAWILARTPRIPNEVKTRLIEHLESIGISKDGLIFSDDR